MAENLDIDKHGKLVLEANFPPPIRLYSKGFVQVGWKKNAPYEKLLGISGSADVSKKTGIGRGIVAGMTGGLNLLTSNKRGDVYLIVVTDTKTHALTTSPGLNSVEVMHKLVTTGETILKNLSIGTYIQPVQSGPLAVNESKESGGSVDDLLSRLQQLGDLHSSGVVSDDEFSQMKAKIMSDLSSSSIEDKSHSAIQPKPTEVIAADQRGGFDVILVASPDSSKMRIQMIKEFRVLNPNVGLKEAKLAIDNPPTVYAFNLSEEHAQFVANQLEEIGAIARIEISPSTEDEQLIGTRSDVEVKTSDVEVKTSDVEVKTSDVEVKTKNEFPKYVASLKKDEAIEELAKLMTNRKFKFYRGYNGSVSIFDDRIEVHREGLVAKMGSHEVGVRAINFTSIVGVYQKAPTVFANGYIKFLVFGEANNQDQKLVPKDRNAILFTYQHRKEQDELFTILEQISNITTGTFAANEAK